MELKKLYLLKESKTDFTNYCMKKLNGTEKRIIEKYFDYCMKKGTFTDLLHNTTIAGERISYGITCMKDIESGRVISNIEDIYKYQKALFEKDSHAFICEVLFLNMFCELERLLRIARTGDLQPNEKRLFNSLIEA